MIFASLALSDFSLNHGYMSNSASHLLGLYLHLARASRRRNQPLVRDKFLVLAGVIAARMQLDAVADHCRSEILHHNPGHMVRRWPTLAEAIEDSDFLHFLKQLQRRFPQEKAERMLAELGIEMAHERDTYFDDVEYAASLLGISHQQLLGEKDDKTGTDS
jgi:hypothetical protein